MSYKHYYFSPIGPICIESDGKSITSVQLSHGTYSAARPAIALLEEAEKELDEYFAGIRRIFDIPISAAGTGFQRHVWSILRTIPYGETRSYKEIAELCGNAKASRAVGMANHRNPVMIMIPCHRVIGHDGTLTGYAGGIGAKQYLLELEKK